MLREFGIVNQLFFRILKRIVKKPIRLGRICDQNQNCEISYDFYGQLISIRWGKFGN